MIATASFPVHASSPPAPVLEPVLEPAGPTELSIDDALFVAVQLHRDGRLDEASLLYRRILEADPRRADALQFLGILLHQRGDDDGAMRLIREAIALRPESPGPWNNLANVHVERGEIDDAMTAYARCLDLDPAFADAHNNVGTIHRMAGDFQRAEASYQRAIESRPAFPDAYNNLSKLMIAQGRAREAVLYACKTITLLPHDPEASRLMGFAFYTLGEVDKAAAIFRQWLDHDPGHPVAAHHLAACTGENVPDRASDDYVTRTFDAFAASFDAKLDVLGYRAPQVVAAALDALHDAAGGGLAILDAGCGTGWCGPLIRRHASRLTGVDLSEKMLDKARARRVYDGLDRSELVSYLQGRADAFDAIVSADTLCYFGGLEPFARDAFAALRAGGLLLFTVEALAGDDAASHRLGPHGRYAHAERYVRDCLAGAGFAGVSAAPEVLRHEGGAAVDGWMFVARRPGVQRPAPTTSVG